MIKCIEEKLSATVSHKLSTDEIKKIFNSIMEEKWEIKNLSPKIQEKEKNLQAECNEISKKENLDLISYFQK